MRFRFLLVWSFIAGWLLVAGVAAQQNNEFDVLVKNGNVYDGTGSKPRHADVGIRGDRVVAVGNPCRVIKHL